MALSFSRLPLSLGLALALAMIPWQDVGALVSHVVSQDRIAEITVQAGPWLIVVLLALAIVFSPIPSGPIAMAAGAVYGTAQGGLLVPPSQPTRSEIRSLWQWAARNTSPSEPDFDSLGALICAEAGAILGH